MILTWRGAGADVVGVARAGTRVWLVPAVEHSGAVFLVGHGGGVGGPVALSVLFVRLAEFHNDVDPALDVVGLAVRLAETPCGPLYGRNVSPDRELAATLHAIAT